MAASHALRPVAAVLAEWQREPAPARRVPIRDAIGLVLAEGLVVPAPIPFGTVALRAGYAVRAGDLIGAGPYSPVFTAKRPPWIEMGDPLPSDTDAVVPADAVAMAGAMAEILLEPVPGETVRRRGEDLAGGEVLRGPGQILRPLDGAVAAAAGLESALVRPFRLLVIVDPQSHPVVAAFTAGLAAGIAAVVASPEILDAGESPGADLILACLAPASRPARLLAEAIGVRAASPALRGAETALAGRWRSTPILLAPPRLDALVPLAYGLIDPFVALRTGREARAVWRRAVLTGKIASSVGLTELALVRETKGGLEPLGSGPITLAALARAEGYLVVPPDSEGWPEGAEVEAYAL